MRLLIATDSGVAVAVTEAIHRWLPRVNIKETQIVAAGLTLLGDADADTSSSCAVSADDVGTTDALELLATVRKQDAMLPFLVVAGGDCEMTASDALDASIIDYVRVRGPKRYDEVAVRIERTVATSGRRPVDPSPVYERVFGQILEGACPYNRDRRFILVSDLLAEPYGATPTELEGEQGYLVEMVYKERPGDPYQRPLDGKTDSLEGKAEPVTPDGESRILSYCFAPFRMAGEVVGATGVSRDVTERQEREQKLKRAREEYQKLIDGINDTVQVIDTDNHILAVSETTVELLGYSQDELLSMAVHGISAGLSDNEASALVTQMPTDRIQIFETAHRTKNGREIPVEISSSLVTYRGRTVVLNVVQDITTRKHYEAGLREQNCLLETQRDELGVLNQVVRHDVRNDLRSVTACAKLLAEYVDDGGAREYIEIVRRRTNHTIELTKMAHDMVEMMGIRGVETKPVPLREVLDAGITSIRDVAPDANAAVGDEVPPVTVFADDMLGSVFRDPLIDATQRIDRDEPTIDVPVAHTEYEDRVVVRVANSDRDVPDERKDAIFAKDGKGLESRGVGLELYLVQSLIEKYDGDMRVENNDPSGSVFAVELRLVGGGQSDLDQPFSTRP